MDTSTSHSGLGRRFADKVVIITGAAGGIGRAVAKRLAEEGAKLALFDRNADGSRESVAEILDAGGIAESFVVDVSDRSTVARAVSGVLEKWGGIDVLVNNAGIGSSSPFLDISDDDWNRTLAVNLGGPFIVSQEVARKMAEHGSGRIVNVTSLAAHTANSNQATYAASKGALVALTRVMAFELAPLGISVNAISPGPIDTPLAQTMLTPEARAAREERIPQGRLGTPDEVAAAVAFLASADAGYVNGTVLVIDGGLLTAGIRAEPK